MWEKITNLIDFNMIGSAASILGLLFTFYVIVSLRKIRNEYMFKGRMPKLKNNLKGHTSKLSKMLQDYDDSIHDINNEIALALVDIKSIKNKVGGGARSSAKYLIKEITRHQAKDNKTEESVRDIYVKCNMLLLEIENLSEDINWS